MSVSKYAIVKGEKFGSWLVIEANRKGSRALVRCICGTERSVRNADLMNGRSRSCGKKVCGSDFCDLIGMRFGYLSVLNKTADRYGNGSIMWMCECICKTICDVSSKHLISGATKSCGCKQAELRLEQIGILSEKDRAVNHILDSYRRGANSRELEFLLTREEFAELIEQRCHYCGSLPDKCLVIHRVIDSVMFNHSGIDRMNPEIGYIKDNCQPCCWNCNRAKWEKSYEEWMLWLDGLVKFRISLVVARIEPLDFSKSG